MNELTKVIFRKWNGKNGTVIAIFPEEVATDDPATCYSYEHIGQGGACRDYVVIKRSRLAKPEEYADLKSELESRGYSLKIIQRVPPTAYEFRRQAMSQIYHRPPTDA